MKKQIPSIAYHPYRYSTKISLLICLALVTSMFALLTAKAADKQVINKNADRALSEEIARQLNGPKLPLNYPFTVKRFYRQQQFSQNWIVKEADAGQTWAAMLMIDCVLQFGLNHADYHPNELLYSKLHDILEHPDRVLLAQQARFEIILTDAMLSFINNLHFGKYNPLFPNSVIDKGGLSFDAMELLSKALLSKDFMTTILSAQPQNKLYQDLQSHMHKVAGVQLTDCYEFPEADVRKMALNMERLRWSALDTGNFIRVNIPSYKLSFYHKGAVDTFRVIVGMPGTPTPSLNSAIKYFTTTPEVRVAQKVFVKELLPKAILDPAYLANNRYAIYNNGGMLITPGKAYLKLILKSPRRYYATQTQGCDNATGQMAMSFDNIYDIYLHDTPERDLFFTNNRAYSHGCVRVQHIVNLAKLLLINDKAQSAVPAMDKAVDKGLRRNFYLKTPMPINITYLTCEMKDGTLVGYNDIYGLDKNLDMLMYRKNDPTLKVTQN